MPEAGQAHKHIDELLGSTESESVGESAAQNVAEGRGLPDPWAGKIGPERQLLPSPDTANPNDILFTQDTVSPNFEDSTTITERVKQLKAGQSPDSVPIIKVVEYEGKLWTLGNRRLLMFQNAGVTDIPINRVSLEDPLINKEFFRKLSPIEGGRRIVVVRRAGREAARRVLRRYGKYND
jgi:hypothetical protein